MIDSLYLITAAQISTIFLFMKEEKCPSPAFQNLNTIVNILSLDIISPGWEIGTIEIRAQM